MYASKLFTSCTLGVGRLSRKCLWLLCLLAVCGVVPVVGCVVLCALLCLLAVFICGVCCLWCLCCVCLLPALRACCVLCAVCLLCMRPAEGVPRKAPAEHPPGGPPEGQGGSGGKAPRICGAGDVGVGVVCGVVWCDVFICGVLSVLCVVFLLLCVLVACFACLLCAVCLLCMRPGFLPAPHSTWFYYL